MPLRSHLAVVALVIGSGWSCATESGGPNRRVETVDSAGVTIVRNLYAGFDTLAVSLVEDMRIGVTEGPPEYQFFRIFGLTVDALGRTFVSNGGTRSVRVYAADGQWVRDIGRQGSGPGEFQGISAPAIWRDSLAVFDPQELRFALFDTAGQFLAAWPLVLPDQRVVYPLKGGPDGWTIWVNQRGSSIRDQPVGAVTLDTVWLGHARLADLASVINRGTSLDSAVFGMVPWPSTPAKWTAGDDGPIGWLPLFAPDRRWALDDVGRIYLSAGYPYQIDVIDGAGNHARRITRSFAERPVTDAEVDDYLGRLAAAPPGPFSQRQLDNARHQADTHRAEFFSVTGALIASADGEIWIQRLDVRFDVGNHEYLPDFTPGPRYWDVLDGSGQYQYTVRMPDRFTPRWIGSGSVVGVLRDENDVEHVARFRVERLPES